jgi:hypothetical protein
MTVAQTDGVKPLALEGKKPEAKAVEAEEVDEPEVRKETKAKPTAVPKKAGNLASVVDNWDADDE